MHPGSGIHPYPFKMSSAYNSCNGCSPSFFDMISLCYKPHSEELVKFLKEHGCLSDQVRCSKCNDIKDASWTEVLFTCRTQAAAENKKPMCAYSESVLTGTFFDNSELDISVVCNLVTEFLSKNYPIIEYLQNELDLPQETVVYWISRIREVLIYWNDKHLERKIGGPCAIVEIDKCTLGKGKDETAQYVFGGIEVETRNIFIVPVEEVESSTVQAIIKDHIEPGTTVVSDCWKSYDRGLSSEGLYDLEENHAITFVSPDSGDLGEHMKQLWRDLEDIVPKYGRKKENMPGYVAEFLFKHKYPNHRERFHHFFKALTELYSPTYFYRCC
uniref:ISXO2-like transposase domain-containing protein n=1 Tax=Cacopsylla melanoneura TaxID=428564 RepID=A0A8D8VKW2_9HEMI